MQAAGSLSFAGAPSKISLDAGGTAVAIEVESELEWQIVCDATWLKAERSGSAVLVSADQNTGKSARKTSLSIIAGDLKRTCSVEQEGGSLILSESQITLKSVPGSTKVIVHATVDWTASSDADWLLCNTKGRELEISAEANEGPAREGTVTLQSAGELSAKLKVRQLSIPESLAGVWVLSGMVWMQDKETGAWSASVRSSQVSLSPIAGGNSLKLYGLGTGFLADRAVAMTLVYDSSSRELYACMGEDLGVFGNVRVRTVELTATGEGSALNVQENPSDTGSIPATISETLDEIAFSQGAGWAFGMWYADTSERIDAWGSPLYFDIVLAR